MLLGPVACQTLSGTPHKFDGIPCSKTACSLQESFCDLPESDNLEAICHSGYLLVWEHVARYFLLDPWHAEFCGAHLALWAVFQLGDCTRDHEMLPWSYLCWSLHSAPVIGMSTAFFSWLILFKPYIFSPSASILVWQRIFRVQSVMVLSHLPMYFKLLLRRLGQVVYQAFVLNYLHIFSLPPFSLVSKACVDQFHCPQVHIRRRLCGCQHPYFGLHSRKWLTNMKQHALRSTFSLCHWHIHVDITMSCNHLCCCKLNVLLEIDSVLLLDCGLGTSMCMLYYML